MGGFQLRLMKPPSTVTALTISPPWLWIKSSPKMLSTKNKIRLARYGQWSPHGLFRTGGDGRLSTERRRRGLNDDDGSKLYFRPVEINNTNKDNVYGVVIMTIAIARDHPVHLINAD